MFYQTQVKSIIQGGVIDTNGKQLSLIGNKLVKQGDFVWTDGKVIFGHTPIRGGGVLFVEPNGIPVLANLLRGYFTKNGVYKNFPIVGNNWIVNDKRHYEHDNGDDDIIDAEIASDGCLLTATKYIQTNGTDTNLVYRYQAYNSLKKMFYTMFSFSQDNININQNIIETLAPVYFPLSFQVAEYARYDNTIFKDTSITIKKDDTIITTLLFSRLLDALEQDTKNFVAKINIPDATSAENHIKSRATLLNFKINPDGYWEALINATIWAERGFKYETSASTYNPGYVKINQTITTTPLTEDGWWRKYERFTDVTITQMPTPRIANGYSSAFTQADYLLKITAANSAISILYKRLEHHPLILASLHSFETSKTRLDNSTTSGFPAVRIRSEAETTWIKEVKEDHALVWSPAYHGDVYGYESYYSRIESDWRQQDHYYEYTDFTYYKNVTSYIYDSRNMPNAPDYDNPTIEIVANFNFPIQDGYQAKITNANNNIAEWKFSGVIDGKNNQVISAILQDKTDAHKWNISLAELRNGYLLGIHQNSQENIAGALYKIDKDNNIEQVGDNLKNFRLRELKKISKAKK